MSTFLTIIVVVLAFSFLVFIHELGHFLMAKKAGIKVHEFAIGFPPRIWKKKKGETLYTINAIPFGGFVKLYGEDATDPKILRSKRSFASKSLRQRIGVVIGGVVMNFIAAFLLFTLGFSIGMKPLLPDMSFINDGTIEITSGIIVKSVPENFDNNQLQTGDNILSINGAPANQVSDLTKKLQQNNDDFQISTAEVIRANQKISLTNIEDDNIELHEFTTFPRLAIESVLPGSASQTAGLKPQDIILSINDQNIFSFEDYQSAIKAKPTAKYKILRNWQITEIEVSLPNKDRVVIEEIINNSPAQKAGLQNNDVILTINDQKIFSPSDAVSKIEQSNAETKIKVKRNNIQKTININRDQNGKLGIRLQQIHPHTAQEISVFTKLVPTSVTNVNNVQYPVHIAAVESLTTMKELSYLTAGAFLNALQSIISKFDVPQEVGGAVAITTMIHQKVQTGPMDVIQIIAYLSLVLAVINILPLPALDGGRLFFLLVEGILGRRIDPRWEAHIHALGFLLLLLLIIVVTFNDIQRLL